MKLAIQEHLLPGRSLSERYRYAKSLGFDGVELWAEGLEERLYDVADALNTAQIPVAALNIGRRDGYLSPVLAEREAAISFMRQTMATAVDLQAEHVIFVPHWGPLRTPDLTPLSNPYKLSHELMVWLLRTVGDLAYALGVTLHMQARQRYDTHFMTTLAQAGELCEIIKDYPYVRIAPRLFDMALEEQDPLTALQQQGARIGYMHLCDSNGGLPGTGLLDFVQVAQALRAIDYDGWLTLSAYEPGQQMLPPDRLRETLPRCLRLLETCGLR